MRINQKYNGTIIGAFFTVSSMLLTLTFIVPALSVMPGMLIEHVISNIVDSDSSSVVRGATLGFLIVSFIASLIVIMFKVRKTIVRNEHVIGMMVSEGFIIPSLAFYIYWLTSIGFRSDGQIILEAIVTFPVSCIGFIGLGILIDIVKLKRNPSLR
jgi:hypothetical protein